MRTRGRVVLGASFVVISASFALVACVGDDPSTGGNANPSDASTSGDSTSSADTAAATDTGSTSTDSGDAGVVETFDGSNPTCNPLFPQDAPAPATFECDGGAYTGTGGAIYPGRYYLVDDKYPPAVCTAGGAGYSDVIQISNTGDGGFTVNAALNDAPSYNTRLTLAWSLATPSSFQQFDVCPGGGTPPPGAISFTATATTLTYFLPGFGNLTYQKF